MKEITYVSVDNIRIRDLEQLKVLGGPFTSSEQENVYLQKRNIDENTKIDRLNIEVRYERDTSLYVPKTSDTFRLKQDYRTYLCICMQLI